MNSRAAQQLLTLKHKRHCRPKRIQVFPAFKSTTGTDPNPRKQARQLINLTIQ